MCIIHKAPLRFLQHWVRRLPSELTPFELAQATGVGFPAGNSAGRAMYSMPKMPLGTL
jgi:hypothetical protein